MNTMTFQQVLQQTLTKLSMQDLSVSNTNQLPSQTQVVEIITTYRMQNLQPLRNKNLHTQETPKLFVPNYTQEKLLPLLIADTLQGSQAKKIAA